MGKPRGSDAKGYASPKASDQSEGSSSAVIFYILCLRFAPLVYFAVVTTQQNPGYFHTPKLFGSSILWKLQVVTVTKTFDSRRLLTAQHARNEPHHRVNQHHSGQFPTGQYKVTNTYLSIYERGNTFIIAFIPSTDN